MEQKLRVLLAEDNPLNQRVMNFALRKNFEITIANNGLEAVEFFSKEDFDIILMDIMMPVMDGYEATARIREIEKADNKQRKTPIVAITANTLDNDRQRCLDCGMDEYLTKPLQLKLFNQILARLGINPLLKTF